MGAGEHRVPMAQDGQILETPRKALAPHPGEGQIGARPQATATALGLECGTQTADLLPGTTHCVNVGFVNFKVLGLCKEQLSSTSSSWLL